MTSAALAGVPCAVPNTFVNNTVADANAVNANFTALVTCLSAAAAAGSNSDITALNALTSPLTPGQGGSNIFLGTTSTGSANAQAVATTVPSGFTLAQGNSVIFVAGFTNTGPMTLIVNALTVPTTSNPTCTGGCPPMFFRQTPSGPQAMVGGEVRAGQLIMATWDGTEFEMISNGPQYGGFGPLQSLASAATTDLGTIPTHNIGVTGSTTITSFGQTASATYPLYLVAFSGAPLITFNNTNCSTVGGCIGTPGSANIQASAGDQALLQYLGPSSGGPGNWQIVLYQRASGTSVNSAATNCGFNVLQMVNGSSNSIINWSYNSSNLVNASGNVPLFSNFQSGSLNITTGNVAPTLAGMDGEAPGNNNFIYVYAISNGSAWSTIGSLSPVAPSLSGLTGYVYVCRMAAFKTNGSGNLYGLRVSGNEARYVVGGANLTGNVLPLNASGSFGSACSGSAVFSTQVFAASSGAGIFAPATAVAIDAVLNLTAAATAIVAPNSSYTFTSAPIVGITAGAGVVAGRILLETSSLSLCGATINVYTYGWKDAVNAN